MRSNTYLPSKSTEITYLSATCNGKTMRLIAPHQFLHCERCELGCQFFVISPMTVLPIVARSIAQVGSNLTSFATNNQHSPFEVFFHETRQWSQNQTHLSQLHSTAVNDYITPNSSCCNKRKH